MSGIGKLDLAADEGQADRGFLRRRRAVAGRPPRHDIGDIDAGTIEPDRGQHQIEQFAGAADKGPADDVLVVAGRFADEHDPALRIAVGEDKLGRGRAQGAAFETPQQSARKSSSVPALAAASRAAIAAASGGGGSRGCGRAAGIGGRRRCRAGCGTAGDHADRCVLRGAAGSAEGLVSSAMRSSGTSPISASAPASR